MSLGAGEAATRLLSPLCILPAWIFSQLMGAYGEPGCVWMGSTRTGAWKSQVRACRSPGGRGDRPRGYGTRRSRWALLPSLHQEITLLSPQRCPSCPSSARQCQRGGGSLAPSTAVGPQTPPAHPLPTEQHWAPTNWGRRRRQLKFPPQCIPNEKKICSILARTRVENHHGHAPLPWSPPHPPSASKQLRPHYLICKLQWHTQEGN